jgi:hypothetical protein
MNTIEEIKAGVYYQPQDPIGASRAAVVKAGIIQPSPFVKHIKRHVVKIVPVLQPPRVMWSVPEVDR